MPLQWDPRTMSTGVEEIDAQHQELIRHLNEFFRLMSLGKGERGLENFMEFLGQYSVHHFRHEEECMNAYRCPMAAANRRAHQEFVALFGRYRERLRKEGPTTRLVVEIQQKLSDWVRNHIIRTDAALRQCVEARVN